MPNMQLVRAQPFIRLDHAPNRHAGHLQKATSHSAMLPFDGAMPGRKDGKRKSLHFKLHRQAPIHWAELEGYRRRGSGEDTPLESSVSFHLVFDGEKGGRSTFAAPTTAPRCFDGLVGGIRTDGECEGVHTVAAHAAELISSSCTRLPCFLVMPCGALNGVFDGRGGWGVA